MKRIMCVRFRQWSINRARRKHSHLHDKPLVLVHWHGQTSLVVFACSTAKTYGIRSGLTLAEAQALCPNLCALEHEPKEDIKTLTSIARWMIRYSPIVSLEAPDAIFLDVTGSERLFRGFGMLSKEVGVTLTGFGFTNRIAIAPTAGGAWALASFGKGSEVISDYTNLRTRLSELPVAGLRITSQVVEELHTLGIETIGQLMALPRKTLAPRFGLTILTRLDQALGTLDEPLTLIRPLKRIQAKIKFEGSVENLEVLWEGFKYLIDEVKRELKQNGHGAKKLLLLFFREYEKAPIKKEIQLSHPSIDLFTLFNLLRCATDCAPESVQSKSGFIGLSLIVLASEALPHEQIQLLEQESKLKDKEFSHLLERLRIKIGENALFLPELVDSHLPEQAFRLSDATLTFSSKKNLEIKRVKARPLYLFPEPTEIQCIALALHGDIIPSSFVHQASRFKVVRMLGPERISGQWWRGRSKTRDYFDVEDAYGKRLWIFRVLETSKWYLHGIFDC